jgi:hypothetical protein
VASLLFVVDEFCTDGWIGAFGEPLGGVYWLVAFLVLVMLVCCVLVRVRRAVEMTVELDGDSDSDSESESESESESASESDSDPDPGDDESEIGAVPEQFVHGIDKSGDKPGTP